MVQCCDRLLLVGAATGGVVFGWLGDRMAGFAP